ncbi:gentamicin 3'-acetyltransferase [Caldimonas brevitalea]|uniref:Gentamicin 3'-acetyltransferase n=2 Tax=Caldimonas brevitalea TaxID=413882 RepID=A0A0G3BWZ0_9BURK|nr:gentamicin 3'-acetyltransferase [Caldimonas brevitalea]
MRQLNAVFAAAFEDHVSYLAEPPGDRYLQEVLGKEHVVVLVALNEGSVVGGLVAYELHKLERARTEVYLYDLAVAQPFRRQGVAARLIEQLRAVAAQRGAWVVYVQADVGDAAAIALYDKLGVREDVLHFDFPVP